MTVRARTGPSVPCNLVVFVIMHAFDDVNFPGLMHKKRSEIIGRQVNSETTYPGPSTAAQCPPCGPDACIIPQSREVSLHAQDVPQPQGAMSRSRINRPRAVFVLRSVRCRCSTHQCYTASGWRCGHCRKIGAQGGGRGMQRATHLFLYWPSCSQVVLSPFMTTMPSDST